MKISTKVLALVLITLLVSCNKKNNPAPNISNAPTQWMRIGTLPKENITALEIINNVIYAGSSTSHKVYRSADNGLTWIASAQINADVRITALALFNNKIYA